MHILNATQQTNLQRLVIGHFRVPPGLCFKTRVGAQPLIWKTFHSHAIKTHFHKKVVHLPHFESEGFWNSEVACYLNLQELGPNALIRNNITLPTVKTTLAYINRNHFLVHHRSPTSRGASDSYQQGTSQAYDI